MIVKLIDLQSLSETEWGMIHDLLDQMFIKSNPDEPTPNHEARQKHLLQHNPDREKLYWIASQNEKIVGFADLVFPTPKASDYEINGPHVFVNIRIHPDYRRQKIGYSLLSEISNKCHELGKSTINVVTSSYPGFEFAKHYGGKIVIEGSESRLQLSEVNWKMMDKWIEEGKSRSPHSKLILYNRIPEEYLEKYVTFENEVVNSQPMGDADFRHKVDSQSVRQNEKNWEERGLKVIGYLAIEPNDDISGFTMRMYNPQEPHKIHIGFTGVHPKYRGRGIGKWLKSSMIIHLKNTYPELKYEITGNADANDAMLAINNKMGYQKYRSERFYKFQVEELFEKLNEN